LKAFVLDKNDQYPFWVLSPTEDGTTIVAGGRKIYVYSFNPEKKKFPKDPMFQILILTM